MVILDIGCYEKIRKELLCVKIFNDYLFHGIFFGIRNLINYILIIEASVIYLEWITQE